MQDLLLEVRVYLCSFLDLEQIMDLREVSHWWRRFTENAYLLQQLCLRYALPQANSYTQFLRRYDHQYLPPSKVHGGYISTFIAEKMGRGVRACISQRTCGGDILLVLVRKDQLRWLKYALQCGRRADVGTLCTLIKEKRMAAFDFLLPWRNGDFLDAVGAYALKKRCTEAILRCVRLGALDANLCLKIYAKRGDLKTCQELVACGATNFQEACRVAKRAAVVDYLTSLAGAESKQVNSRLVQAISEGNRELVFELLKEETGNWNDYLFVAAQHNNLELVRLFVVKGASNYAECLAMTTNPLVENFLRQMCT